MPAAIPAAPAASASGLSINGSSMPALVAGGDGAANVTVELCLSKDAAAAPLALDLAGFSGTDAEGRRYALQTTSVAVPKDKATTLAPGRCLPVAISVTGLFDGGPTTAVLRNEGREVATVFAVNAKVPFTLKASDPNPDRLDVTMAKDESAKISIRNLDDLTYRVVWNWELGASVCSGSFTIGPRSKKDLFVRASGSDFRWLESGFLRPGIAKGKLTLRRDLGPGFSHVSVAPIDMPVTARLSYFGSLWQSFLNVVSIAILLSLGVFASLAINFALPMQRRRVDTKQRLADITEALKEQGGLVGSRTLNVLRVEAGRLTALVNSRWPLFPEIEALLDRVDARVAALDRRLGTTRDIRALLDEARTNPALTLHEVEAVANRCRAALKIVEMGSPSSDDLTRAAGELAASQAIVAETVGSPKAETIAALAPRADAIAGLGGLPPDPDPAAAPDPLHINIWDRFATLVSRSRSVFLPVWPGPTTTPVAPVGREAYVAAAKALWKAPITKLLAPKRALRSNAWWIDSALFSIRWPSTVQMHSNDFLALASLRTGFLNSTLSSTSCRSVGCAGRTTISAVLAAAALASSAVMSSGRAWTWVAAARFCWSPGWL